MDATGGSAEACLHTKSRSVTQRHAASRATRLELLLFIFCKSESKSCAKTKLTKKSQLFHKIHESVAAARKRSTKTHCHIIFRYLAFSVMILVFCDRTKIGKSLIYLRPLLT
jgi:hypothetical protein